MVDDGLLRLESLRRLYVNTVIFTATLFVNVAVTVAPSTVGAPTLTESPPTNNTLSNVNESPSLTSNFQRRFLDLLLL